MKRFLGLLVGALLAIGLIQTPAKATTINLSAAPTDTDFTGGIHVGTPVISFPPLSFHINPVSFDDVVTVNLSSATGFADLSFSTVFDLGISSISYTLFSAADLANPLSSYTQLAAGTYFLHIAGSTAFGAYVTQLAASAVTPIPPALLLFVTALGGLGFAGYARRKVAA